jgi:hypothetical protein
VVSTGGDPWTVVATEAFRLMVLAGVDGLDREDDNVDVEVHLASDGSRWGATVFTYRNLDTLMRQWAQSGECRNGLYIWADHMIVVRELTTETLLEVVGDLVEQQQLETALRRLLDE